MKLGEIWSDKEDGTLVKIFDIVYSKDVKDYVVWYEGMEKDWGNYLERKDFLEHYELGQAPC